ncbi:hypothetical protein GBAR_LOCUS18027, partial [Geodia barretti]
MMVTILLNICSLFILFPNNPYSHQQNYSLSLSFNHQSILSDASRRVSVTDISKDVGQDHNALACLYKTATLSRYSRLVRYLNDSMILSTGHFGWISLLTLWNSIPMATLY